MRVCCSSSLGAVAFREFQALYHASRLCRDSAILELLRLLGRTAVRPYSKMPPGRQRSHRRRSGSFMPMLNIQLQAFDALGQLDRIDAPLLGDQGAAGALGDGLQDLVLHLLRVDRRQVVRQAAYEVVDTDLPRARRSAPGPWRAPSSASRSAPLCCCTSASFSAGALGRLGEQRAETRSSARACG